MKGNLFMYVKVFDSCIAFLFICSRFENGFSDLYWLVMEDVRPSLIFHMAFSAKDLWLSPSIRTL